MVQSRETYSKNGTMQRNLCAQALKRIELDGGTPLNKWLRARSAQRSNGPPPPLETKVFKERHTSSRSWNQRDAIKDETKEAMVLAPTPWPKQIITRDGASRKDDVGVSVRKKVESCD